jgi:hypothetical protein
MKVGGQLQALTAIAAMENVCCAQCEASAIRTSALCRPARPCADLSHARAEGTLGRAVTQFALPQVVCPLQGQITSRLHRKQLYELHFAFRRGWVL